MAPKNSPFDPLKFELARLRSSLEEARASFAHLETVAKVEGRRLRTAARVAGVEMEVR